MQTGSPRKPISISIDLSNASAASKPYIGRQGRARSHDRKISGSERWHRGRASVSSLFRLKCAARLRCRSDDAVQRRQSRSPILELAPRQPLGMRAHGASRRRLVAQECRARGVNRRSCTSESLTRRNKQVQTAPGSAASLRSAHRPTESVREIPASGLAGWECAKVEKRRQGRNERATPRRCKSNGKATAIGTSSRIASRRLISNREV